MHYAISLYCALLTRVFVLTGVVIRTEVYLHKSVRESYVGIYNIESATARVWVE